MPDQGVRSLDLRENDFRCAHALQVPRLSEVMRSGKERDFFIQRPESANGQRRLMNHWQGHDHQRRLLRASRLQQFCLRSISVYAGNSPPAELPDQVRAMCRLTYLPIAATMGKNKPTCCWANP